MNVTTSPTAGSSGMKAAVRFVIGSQGVVTLRVTGTLANRASGSLDSTAMLPIYVPGSYAFASKVTETEAF
jgi:hypothetical protein